MTEGGQQPKFTVIEGGGRAPDPHQVLREMYTKYGSSVYGRCLFLLKNAAEAEDAMQEVFARAFTNLDSFRGEASPLTWLTKIATHHCLNVIRARKAKWKDVMKRDAEAAPPVHDAPNMVEARDTLAKTMALFDVETQRAVIHYHVDGMRLEDVAKVLGRSIPTVRKRLAKFADALEQNG